ncbi:S-adenosylmethionine decarboxylase proenzyme-like [Ipomoea triloba]|uniref:S-adenosylmethionine decarboxylase proenzyme-like n=1 Tax=Ipomoea triloba TaxID=35885 RepID=UPI00125DF23C|nr:S-adenosylmethionine decarboxylase proenzyme-like [Ipomoea triloba]XP_031121846.1 S-adenosylmethionine decarboxylase proenzyme-like [Ipomoea triloba]XP_031121847.1 S-adenosylmethionine decarboxylase proenzyme-like [Ipomoea triloba]
MAEALSSAIGFEGFEKRLEISFTAAPMFRDPHGMGLRDLIRAQLDSILEPAFCTIVSELSGAEFDSYVLSESSMFIYPLKIVLKTCGTTRLLLSVPVILELADSLSLGVDSVRYSRGTFVFQNSQPAPHRSFSEEVAFLNSQFKNGVGFVLGDPEFPGRNWHVYVAEVGSGVPAMETTVEICMTGLSREKAAVFFKRGGGGGEMTKMSRICDVIPSHVICEFEFDPCGYSMNGMDGTTYSTVHVTPEEGFSYASYEAMGVELCPTGLEPLVKRVLTCFEPAEFSVAVTRFGVPSRDKIWNGGGVDVDGYTCQFGVTQELPGGGLIDYRCFTTNKVTFRPSALQCGKETEEEVTIVGGLPFGMTTLSMESPTICELVR